jgi:hypothetical protein
MDDRSQRIVDRFNRPVLIAAGLTIPVILLERLSLPAPWRTAVDVLNWAIWPSLPKLSSCSWSSRPDGDGCESTRST